MGSGLKAMNDGEPPSSDPIAKVSLGDEEFYSPVRRNTLEPMWGKEGGYFKFEVDQEEYESMKLSIQILDEDPDGNQLIGEIKISLKDKCKKNGPWVDDNYTLCGSNGRPDEKLGKAYIKIRYG